MDQPLRIVLVDAIPKDRRLIGRKLRREFSALQVIPVTKCDYQKQYVVL